MQKRYKWIDTDIILHFRHMADPNMHDYWQHRALCMKKTLHRLCTIVLFWQILCKLHIKGYIWKGTFDHVFNFTALSCVYWWILKLAEFSHLLYVFKCDMHFCTDIGNLTEFQHYGINKITFNSVFKAQTVKNIYPYVLIGFSALK